MTLALDDVLERADEETLAALVGPGAAQLLAALGSMQGDAVDLLDVARRLHPPASILLDAAHRRRVLPLLRPQEATALVAALDVPVPPGISSYAVLATLAVPRGSLVEARLLAFFGASVPERPPPAPSSATAAAGYGLFPHQRAAMQRAAALLDASPHRVMLHLPTGAGKTRTAMHVVCRHLRERPAGTRGVVLWTVYGEELCEQAASEAERAWRHLGDRPVEVVRLWGDHPLVLPEGDAIVVASLPRLYAVAIRCIADIAAIARAATLVVVDEAHQAVAPTYRAVLDAVVANAPGTGLLGLSATPGRAALNPATDADALAAYFGGRKVTLETYGHATPIDFLVAEGFLARARFEALPCHGALGLTPSERDRLAQGLDIPASVLERLALDAQRNVALVHAIERLTGEHDRVIVFAATVGHADLIAGVLQARGTDACAVSASTPPGLRQSRLDRYRSPDTGRPMVIVNYGILTTGFDAPRTSAVVVARPTRSVVLYSQMVGRALRGPRAGGRETAHILTLVDRSLEGFGSVADAFTHWDDVWNP